jgi:hypothetical protein
MGPLVGVLVASWYVIDFRFRKGVMRESVECSSLLLSTYSRSSK